MFFVLHHLFFDLHLWTFYDVPLFAFFEIFCFFDFKIKLFAIIFRRKQKNSNNKNVRKQKP